MVAKARRGKEKEGKKKTPPQNVQVFPCLALDDFSLSRLNVCRLQLSHTFLDGTGAYQTEEEE